MIARRHDEHRKGNALKGCEHADDGRTCAADDDGKHTEAVFTDDQHERHDQKAEKARHFAQGDHETVVRGGKAADFDGVVRIEQGRALESYRAAQSKQEKKKIHAGVARYAGNDGFHGTPWGGKDGTASGIL